MSCPPNDMSLLPDDPQKGRQMAQQPANHKRADEDHDRAVIDAPTTDRHPTPCARLMDLYTKVLEHVGDMVRQAREVGAMRAYLVSATIGVLTATLAVAGWFLFRTDGAVDRLMKADQELYRSGNERAVSIGVLQVRAAQTDIAIAELKASTAAGFNRLDAKLDLVIQRQNGQHPPTP
jgi:hypothetical protein